MSAVNRVLGDVVRQIEAGRSPKTLERDAAPDEPGVLKVSAVSWGSFDPAAAKAMPSSFTAPDSHKVRRGDFIVSRANTGELTGAVAIAQADYPNRYLSDKLLRLVLDSDQVATEYLLFALRAPSARAHIERSASGTSHSMRNIAQDALLKTPIVLPDLDVQRRVASQLQHATAAGNLALAALSHQALDSTQLTVALLREQFGAAGVVAGVVTKANWIPLRSLARLESGHTPSRRHPEWWGGDVPWLALPDIRKLHGKVALRPARRSTRPASPTRRRGCCRPAPCACRARHRSASSRCSAGRWPPARTSATGSATPSAWTPSS